MHTCISVGVALFSPIKLYESVLPNTLPCSYCPLTREDICLRMHIPTGSLSHPTAQYPYSNHLERLASRKLLPLPQHATDIVSPIAIPFWQEHLSQHPDQQFAQLILTGLKEGFPVGFCNIFALVIIEIS